MPARPGDCQKRSNELDGWSYTAATSLRPWGQAPVSGDSRTEEGCEGPAVANHAAVDTIRGRRPLCDVCFVSDTRRISRESRARTRRGRGNGVSRTPLAAGSKERGENRRRRIWRCPAIIINSLGDGALPAMTLDISGTRRRLGKSRVGSRPAAVPIRPPAFLIPSPDLLQTQTSSTRPPSRGLITAPCPARVYRHPSFTGSKRLFCTGLQ